MSRPRSTDPQIRVSPDERAALMQLAPLRTTIERIVTQRHEQLLGRPADPRAVNAEVEMLWTIVLEAFRRGVRGLRQGLHRGSGIDHEMLDQALQFALIEGLNAPEKKKG
jgi:hypothetical protein